MRRLARAAALAGAALAVLPAAASARPSVLLLFVPDAPIAAQQGPGPDPLLRDLAARPGLAFGLMGATQGAYTPEQALLDITQGTRVSPTAYDPHDPTHLSLRPAGQGGDIAGWSAERKRAGSAPGHLLPGRLAGRIPRGAAYAGVAHATNLEAVAAADSAGHVSHVSLGPPGTLVARTRRLLAERTLVVASLPSAAPYLGQLLQARLPHELVIVTTTPPQASQLQLLPVALAGAGTDGRGLTSDTTRRDGLVTGIDVAPTVLDHLGIHVPSQIRGERLRTADRRSPHQLEQLRLRFRHVAPRRIRTLGALIAFWGLLAGAALLVARRRGLGWAGRVGALAFMWVPSVILVPAALDPSRALVETGMVVAGAFALGALTDRLVAWPRAPLVPAAVCLVAYTIDLGFGSDLINVSLLGPNPRAGARFFGIGNELEPALPFLLFLGLAAAMTGGGRTTRRAVVFGIGGLAVGLIVGSGYLGADVGGVITASVGAAVAVILMLPGHVSRKRVALALVSVPVLAVGALALLDLATGADSHFSRNFLHSGGGSSDVWETFTRRYDYAWHALRRGKMPIVTVLALGGVILAFVRRDRLFAPLPDPAWRAALGAGVAAGIGGALTNDSGPLLFVVAAFMLGLAAAYIQGGAGLPSSATHARIGDSASAPPGEPSALQQSGGAKGVQRGNRPPAQVS